MKPFIEILSQMLEAEEREAVLGDFEESSETDLRALRDLLGLLARRQVGLWKSWWPWIALVGLAVPFGIQLHEGVRRVAGSSAVYSWMYLNNWTSTYFENSGFRLDLLKDAAGFVLEYMALICWSWTIGFEIAWLSCSALLINGAVFCVLLFETPAVTTVARHYGDNAAAFEGGFYRLVLPVILQFGLVVIPFLRGILRGLRVNRPSQRQLWLLTAVLLGSITFDHSPGLWKPWMLPEVIFIFTIANVSGRKPAEL